MAELVNDMLSLITDRTAADIKNIKRLAAKGWQKMTDEEKAAWLNGQRGAYNADDLNRVENAVALLAEVLKGLPEELKTYAELNGVGWDVLFDVPYDAQKYNVEVKTDWNALDIPKQLEMARYLANVVLLRNALKYATSALPSTMDNLTYDKANAIEQALCGLDEAIKSTRNTTKQHINNTAAAWTYSGEIYAGEAT